MLCVAFLLPLYGRLPVETVLSFHPLAGAYPSYYAVCLASGLGFS